MNIQCPECSKELNIGSAKPGKYQPKCKHCGRSFRLRISDETPPRTAVAKLPTPTPTTDHNAATRIIEATIDAGATHAAIDATVDASAGATHAAIDATVDGGAVTEATTAGTLIAESSPYISVSRSASASAAVSASHSAASVRRGNQPVAKSNTVNKDAAAELPAERLGGYRLQRLLGRGAMGEVYEARQISLDRPVALKTIRASIADNASSLARFTREAYAAAQLTHHNVVQIYDFGEDRGKHYFSMEWVRGGPLSDLVRAKGALEPRLAASYTLQAARGLAYAHRSGMVHRDVKPANLLLTDEGVVKVADLGLVKIPDLPEPATDGVGNTKTALSAAASGTEVTMHGTAVGTPAYMSPEQSADAATVDHRADIYSLGCSLFYLLAGRPPFEGSQISEVIKNHIHQSPPKITSINPLVPPELEQMIERAMAKRPSDRYSTLAEMITELESFLDIRGEGAFSPTRHQADEWGRIVGLYTASARVVSPMLLVVMVLTAGLLMSLISIMIGWRWIATGPTTVLAAIITAMALLTQDSHSPVVAHVRSWIGTLRWLDWAITVIAAIVAILVVVFIGMWPGVLLGMVAGVAVGAACYFGMLSRHSTAADEAIKAAELFIRDLRLAGSDEDGVRDFCARYGGKQWQSLYERLFGYSSLVKQRQLLATDRAFREPTGSSLRDKFCAKMAAMTAANRTINDQSKLEKIERKGLRAEGMSEADAAERAYQMAAALIEASKTRADSGGVYQADSVAVAAAKRKRFKEMMAEARSGKYQKKRDRLAPLKLLMGAPTRLAAGLLLLAVFAMWGNSQGLFNSIKEIDMSALRSGQIDLNQISDAANTMAAQAQSVDNAPATMGAMTVSSPWSMGIAGLLLCVSVISSGWKLTPFAIVATIVILAGTTLGIPAIGTWLPAWVVAAGAGAVIYLPGLYHAESKDPDF